VAAGAALRIFPSDVVHIDVMSKTCTVEENYSKLNPYPDDTIEAYASRRAEETAPYCAKVAPRVSTEELAAHWRDIERHNKRLLAFRSFSKNFIIEAYEQSGEFLRRWYLHIGADGVSVDDNPPAGFVSAYTFKIPMLMLRKVVDGETNWDEMVASHHMLLSRDPDIFDPQFFALLRYHHAPARGRLFVLAGDSNEMIALAGDPTTRIQRFCPHAGEDLTGVEACNGVFVCPRHRWEWDLRTGECIKGGNIPLRVEHGPTVPDHKFAAV
jgi:UDP-MurNAc hydroxylase